MKGLYRYLSPFSPDQSGASSVLYELGGLIVILDAGGCAGNVCGFDEPRWFQGKGKVFSAGLRDMDAILGRDQYLMDKIGDALESVDASFIGIIGTPVPSVIGTDYRALKRMAERRFNLPTVTIDTNGMEDYDIGEKKAYLALLNLLKEAHTGESSLARKLLADAPPEQDYDAAVFGATPLDILAQDSATSLVHRLAVRGITAACIGYGAGFGSLAKLYEAKRSYVVSPSGLAPARLLKEKKGIPYSVGFPYDKVQEEEYKPYDGKILVIHQQILADEIRTYLKNANCTGEIDTASFFTMDEEKKEGGDVRLMEEDDLIRLVTKGGYDTVIADPLIKRAIREYQGKFVDLPHAAVSGNLFSGKTEEEILKDVTEAVHTSSKKS